MTEKGSLSSGNERHRAMDFLSPPLPEIDLSKPRYDQTTYMGRAKHFFETANPLNIFVSNRRLEEAAKLVKDYKSGHVPPGTREEQLWAAKRLYDSAYHPGTGEKMFIIGRMSFQVPGNMTITGCMMTFYKNPLQVVFWQWLNQSFNSVVNHTNRGGSKEVSYEEIAVPYVAATATATTVALTLNYVIAKRVPALVGRLIPFAAVAAANCVNIPLMRQSELKDGIPVFDEHENKLGMSTAAAKKGISQVVVSRILMALPGMVIPAFIMNSLEKKGSLKRIPWVNAPLQILLVGFCLTFATPLCCAIFPQKSSIPVSRLDGEIREYIQAITPDTKTVYFNKGL